ncbi:helix-turn-helix domain-containing protein [Paenibacillus agricola]|uniref:Helix-turn-helix protein n=1 Tax=Paenibacillus agricola TaxID=2716264 RepID=A0ABX0JMU9_9BACL|nr:hypothetical protein [Paenibacillus agricola]NHN35580.1 hypothetical protein [Paenibacillus agricola]
MSDYSTNFVYLSVVREQRQKIIEEQARQLQTFKSVEEMDAHVLAFIQTYGLTLNETSLKVLEICCRHSLRAFGVSWLSNKSIAAMVQASTRTVQRSIDRLEQLNIIKRKETYERNGGQGTNLIIIQPIQDHFLIETYNEQAVSKDAELNNPVPSEIVADIGVGMPVVTGVAIQITKSPNLLISNNKLKIDRQHALSSMPSDTPEFPEIIESLNIHGKKLKPLPTSATSIMETYMPRIYSMLVSRFKNLLDASIVEIACDLYIEKYYDLRGLNPKFEIVNPVGWFHDAYKDAIHVWKAKRYKKEFTQPIPI